MDWRRVEYRQHDWKNGHFRQPLQEASGKAEAVGRLHAAQVVAPASVWNYVFIDVLGEGVAEKGLMI